VWSFRSVAAAIFILFSLAEAQITTSHGSLKLVHARATTTAPQVRMKITEPATDELVSGPDVRVQFTAGSWTNFHFILDNQPFQTHSSPEPFVFRNVKPGIHVIRAFPVYPWHEAVKQQEALAIVRFYVKEKTGNSPLDFAKPMMIYSTPEGVHQEDEKNSEQPHPGILVDWFLHNVSMGSKAGYFVRISVDGNVLTSMKEWRPHYIQGLAPGEHRIKLELLHNGVSLTNNWNTTERIITVE
jgi:hypothetical protein